MLWQSGHNFLVIPWKTDHTLTKPAALGKRKTFRILGCVLGHFSEDLPEQCTEARKQRGENRAWGGERCSSCRLNPDRVKSGEVQQSATLQRKQLTGGSEEFTEQNWHSYPSPQLLVKISGRLD